MSRFPARTRFLCAVAAVLALHGCYRFRGPLDWGRSEPQEESGRRRVELALAPPRVLPVPSVRRGRLSTVSSSAALPTGLLKRFDPARDHVERAFAVRLADGTRVGGLLFLEPGDPDARRPLLIASFGFLQDRWGSEPAKFYELYLRGDDRLPGDVLMLDHPTAGSFTAANGVGSIGAYDDGRMWIEVARRLRRELRPSSIHLYGVSMSGQTVIHALAEDARLGLGLFASGLAIATAPDFREVPGGQLAGLSSAAENPWRRTLESAGLDFSGGGIQSRTVWLLFRRQFVPSYGALLEKELDLEREQLPEFFWNSYEARLAHLRRSAPASWNPEFESRNLGSYMTTTRVAGVVDRVRVPLVLLHARNDPAVPRPLFAELAESAQDNPWVVAREVPLGGHNGFDVPYGREYLGRVIRLMLDPAVLEGWTGQPGPTDLTRLPGATGSEPD